VCIAGDGAILERDDPSYSITKHIAIKTDREKDVLYCTYSTGQSHGDGDFEKEDEFVHLSHKAGHGHGLLDHKELVVCFDNNGIAVKM